MSPVVELRMGDRLRLRRAHPCGGAVFEVDRLGADIGLRCVTCAHRILMDRLDVERRYVEHLARGTEAQ